MSFERRLQHVTRHALDESADQIAPDVLARLAAIREAALAQSGTAPVPSRWAPSLAMAATLLFAVGVWQQTRLPSAESELPPAAPAIASPVVAVPNTALANTALANTALANTVGTKSAVTKGAVTNSAAPDVAGSVGSMPVTAQLASAVVREMQLLDELEFAAWMELEAQDESAGVSYEG